MVSTRQATKGKKIKLPKGRDLPSELHSYAPRKFGDWYGSYADYKKQGTPKRNESLPRVAYKSIKLRYIRFMLELQRAHSS